MHIGGFFRKTNLVFVEKVYEHDDIYSFRFRATAPIKHIAGQHALFLLPGLRGGRIFSLSSSPHEEHVMFTTHVRSGSRYKQRLTQLKPGDTMTMFGPVLDFIFKKEASEYVFLAQGIGITPFRSLLLDNTAATTARRITLLHVSKEAFTFSEELTPLTDETHLVQSSGAFTATLTEVAAKQPNAHYYLSGSPHFVRSTKRLLRAHHISRRHMHSDNFFGY